MLACHPIALRRYHIIRLEETRRSLERSTSKKNFGSKLSRTALFSRASRVGGTGELAELLVELKYLKNQSVVCGEAKMAVFRGRHVSRNDIRPGAHSEVPKMQSIFPKVGEHVLTRGEAAPVLGMDQKRAWISPLLGTPIACQNVTQKEVERKIVLDKMAALREEKKLLRRKTATRLQGMKSITIDYFDIIENSNRIFEASTLYRNVAESFALC